MPTSDSRRSAGVPPLEVGIAGGKLLDDLAAFCARRGVRGQVCLTGGNPMLHPDFLEIYRAAARAGFTLSILGNPAPRERIEEFVAIRRPLYYQVALDGLEEHDDRIRGPGSFARAISFLDLLREQRVRAHVMLTLTRDSLDQVLPLGERLRGLAKRFTYNRLAARRYREGSRACGGCPLRERCGGCYAVVYGHGQDIFAARDPHCFRE